MRSLPREEGFENIAAPASRKSRWNPQLTCRRSLAIFDLEMDDPPAPPSDLPRMGLLSVGSVQTLTTESRATAAPGIGVFPGAFSTSLAARVSAAATKDGSLRGRWALPGYSRLRVNRPVEDPRVFIFNWVRRNWVRPSSGAGSSACPIPLKREAMTV